MSTSPITKESISHDVTAELALLRSQVEDLMKERVTPALHSVALQAEHAAKAATDEIHHQTARLSETVQEKPLLALGLAAAAGFILASMIRR